AEYINPFFPYLGYELGNEAVLNMWRVYAKAIPEDSSNIRYSFEMEGDSPANPLDRGDAAMIAYGLSHYLLALGDVSVAEELWPLLEWCLEYNHRKLNAAGVVASQSDEMEGRIETGDANLSTSSLYYGALETSISLGRALKKKKTLVRAYQERRVELAAAIESFFGCQVEGLETYRYFDGHDALRHWICLPLVVGLHDRAPGTLDGLFDRLWTDNGVAVEKNHPNPAVSEIFWDRGTLYALRGAFIAGGTERANERLLQFSRERLLGERVPYVVEAYPEGSMAHLSAENGLYCRIFTEGVFGILPTGFRSFRLQPRMPEEWDKMALRNIYAFGQKQGFDLEVTRAEDQLVISVVSGKSGREKTFTLKDGEAIEVSLW
ncbi:MAG: six-hairpin glycosidase-like protein, partial [Bacteroidota bacterium]